MKMAQATALYRSAGILALRDNPQTKCVEMLVAWELTWGTKRCQFYDSPGGCRQGNECEFLHLRGATTADELETLRINFLGGKREEALNETSRDTAVREFNEETHRLVDVRDARVLVDAVSTTRVRTYGAYDLYIGWLPPAVDSDRVVQLYNFLGPDPPLAFAEKLHWLPLKLLRQIEWDTQAGYHIKLRDTAKKLPVSHLVWSFAQLYGRYIDNFSVSIHACMVSYSYYYYY